MHAGELAPEMRRMRTVLFVVWLCVIWGHSLMPGDLSSAESSRFVFLLKPLFNLFGNNDEQLMTLVIRKGAHFSEYVVLAVLACRMFAAYGREGRSLWLACAAVCMLVPCVDECIQLQVPERAGMVQDVLIDMAGGTTGLLLMRSWHRFQ